MCGFKHTNDECFWTEYFQPMGFKETFLVFWRIDCSVKKSRFTEQVSQIISIKIDIMQPIFLTNSYSGGKHKSTSIILTHMECLLLDKKLKWSVTLYNLKGSLGFALIASVFFNHHIWVYLHHWNLPQSKALEKDLWLLFTDLHLWNVFTNINHVMLSCINN